MMTQQQKFFWLYRILISVPFIISMTLPLSISSGSNGYNESLPESLNILLAGVKGNLDSLTGALTLSPTKHLISFESLLNASKSINGFLINIRRRFHEFPELAYEEHQTSLLIQHILKEFDIRFTSGWGVDRRSCTNLTVHYEHMSSSEHSATESAKLLHPECFTKSPSKGTGIVAEIGTGQSPCIGLRADFDGLPIQELANVPFKSKVDNKMHACGHDVHTTMLLGAAILLKSIESQLPGTVKLIFQPAEENGAGALMMRLEGVLQLHPKIQEIYGFHVLPGHPVGHIYTNPGLMMAAASGFKVTLHGRGGHGGMPHLSIDPMAAAISLSQALYSIPSREVSFSEEEFAVLSVTSIQASQNTSNVIPESVSILGTFRSPNKKKMLKIKERIHEITEGVAAAFRCRYEINYGVMYPPTVNDQNTTRFFEEVARFTTPDKKIHNFSPVMGAEDFSFYQEEAPGTFSFIGSGETTKMDDQILDAHFSLHSPHFVVNEEVLIRGASTHVFVAVNAILRLSKDQNKNEDEKDDSLQRKNIKSSVHEREEF